MSEIAYIVTRGEYSDYRIVGVFSTREKASAYIAWADALPDSWNDHQIEEYPIDLGNSVMARGPIWRVYMFKNGDTRTVDQEHYVLGDGEPPHWGRTNPYDRTQRFFDICADTPERAIKIANERRSQLLAENRWESA